MQDSAAFVIAEFHVDKLDRGLHGDERHGAVAILHVLPFVQQAEQSFHVGHSVPILERFGFETSCRFPIFTNR